MQTEPDGGLRFVNAPTAVYEMLYKNRVCKVIDTRKLIGRQG